MMEFDTWCSMGVPTRVEEHAFRVLDAYDAEVGRALATASLPEAYADTSALALIAERFGKPGVAAFLRDRMPTKKSARSGDMGEILATAYLKEEHGYVVGPSRLIDRDHQEWAMRGDDVIAARLVDDSKLRLIKAEAKSRLTLGAVTVKEARDGLARNNEMPSPHSLSQFAVRLLSTNDRAIGEAVLHVQLTGGVRPRQLRHLMFLFTSSDPTAHVRADLEAYAGSVRQLTITLRVQGHQEFINDAYNEVIADAS